MKYIMFLTEHPVPRVIPIIFPNNLVHSLVAEALAEVLEKHSINDAKLFSAGEINIIECQCSGKSSTLDLGSHPGDTQAISSYDYAHGIIDALQIPFPKRRANKMCDLTSQDLGNGFKLVFQKPTVPGNHVYVRAVVKDASGTIVARGNVVPETQYKLTQFQATQEWLAMQHPNMTQEAAFEPLDEETDEERDRDEI